MAAIQNDEQFRLAAAQWLSTQTLSGAAFLDATARRLFDDSSATEITPSMAVLEAALDTALANGQTAATRESDQQTANAAVKGALITSLLLAIDADITLLNNQDTAIGTETPVIASDRTATTAISLLSLSAILTLRDTMVHVLDRQTANNARATERNAIIRRIHANMKTLLRIVSHE